MATSKESWANLVDEDASKDDDLDLEEMDVQASEEDPTSKVEKLLDAEAYEKWAESLQTGTWMVHTRQDALYSRLGLQLEAYPLHHSTPSATANLLLQVRVLKGWCPLPGCSYWHQWDDSEESHQDFLSHWIKVHVHLKIKCEDTCSSPCPRQNPRLDTQKELYRHLTKSHGLVKGTPAWDVHVKGWYSRQVMVFGPFGLPGYNEAPPLDYHYELESKARAAGLPSSSTRVVDSNPLRNLKVEGYLRALHGPDDVPCQRQNWAEAPVPRGLGPSALEKSMRVAMRTSPPKPAELFEEVCLMNRDAKVIQVRPDQSSVIYQITEHRDCVPLELAQPKDPRPPKAPTSTSTKSSTQTSRATSSKSASSTHSSSRKSTSTTTSRSTAPAPAVTLSLRGQECRTAEQLRAYVRSKTDTVNRLRRCKSQAFRKRSAHQRSGRPEAVDATSRNLQHYASGLTEQLGLRDLAMAKLRSMGEDVSGLTPRDSRCATPDPYKMEKVKQTHKEKQRGRRQDVRSGKSGRDLRGARKSRSRSPKKPTQEHTRQRPRSPGKARENLRDSGPKVPRTPKDTPKDTPKVSPKDTPYSKDQQCADLRVDLAEAKTALQQARQTASQAEADRDRARQERDTARQELQLAQQSIAALESRLSHHQDPTRCPGTQDDPDLEFLVVTNRAVVVQSAELRNHQLAMLGELLQQMQRSGTGVPPTSPASGTVIRASNGRAYSLAEVADPEEVQQPPPASASNPVMEDSLLTVNPFDPSEEAPGPMSGVDHRSYSLEEGDLQIVCDVGPMVDGHPLDP